MGQNSKYRVTQVSNSGERTVSMMDEQEMQKFRAMKLKKIRKEDLNLTQKKMANAIGVNLRTLQDWEIGRSPMPKPVELLMNLMKEMPAVKKKILSSIDN